MADDFAAIVIGAGVAGLAALRELDRTGLDNVLCLEARSRIGGRIHSVHDPLCPTAIELGAEFIHGRSREVWDVAEASQLTIYDCGDSAVRMEHGVAQKEDVWQTIGNVMQDMQRAAAQGPDCTFQDFLRNGRYSDEAKQWGAGYVEGFNAARSEEVSIAALAQEAKAADEIDGESAFRLVNGYDCLPLALLRSVVNAPSKLRLNSIVESVAWRPGAVSVSVRNALTNRMKTFRARSLIVTVPLGVLQSSSGQEGNIAFQPEPKEILAAAKALRMGHAMRVVLRFREAFWESKPDGLFAGFLLSDEKVFPTWWTTLAVRAPIITGWSAGPKADELIAQQPDAVVTKALGALARIVGTDSARAQDLLEAAYFHNWSLDPFARGAYSYLPVGGLAAREILAQPVDNTLFFAGEATECHGHASTVHGAIATGRRAARQASAALR